MATLAETRDRVPQVGDVVRLRTRTYLVEGIDPGTGGHLVRMACLDDDAQGQPLEAVWELELDREVLDKDVWKSIGKRGFDSPRLFGAFVHTLRWHCVTATDPTCFKSPFRAGIRIDAYQLEPLRKACVCRASTCSSPTSWPRQNDRGRAHRPRTAAAARQPANIVVACPPSMLLQWKEELETVSA